MCHFPLNINQFCAAERYLRTHQVCSHSSVSQKIPYRVYKSSLLEPVLSQTNPVHTTPSSLNKINLNVIYQPSFGLLGDFFSFGFPSNNLYPVLISLIRATCPSHLILIDLMFLAKSANQCTSSQGVSVASYC
jgi:hypothetical protein